MKLYVWTGVFSDFTDGCAFAIAETKEQAVELAIQGHEFYSLWLRDSSLLERCRRELMANQAQELPVDQPFGFSLSGGGR